MTDSSDAQLVVRAQKGEMNAIGQLYDLHRESIFRYFWLRLDDRPLAEDLAGDVFMRMLDALPRYRAYGLPFRAWLYRIAHNLAIDYFRKMDHQRTVPLEIIDELPAGDDDLGVALDRTLLNEQVRAALVHLEPTQAEVVTLRFLLGFSLLETALTLGKTEAAIKALQHRGLSALRYALQSVEEAPTR